MKGRQLKEHVSAAIREVLLVVLRPGSRKLMVFTDIESNRPDSSVAQVTSTFLAPSPPDMRRSDPFFIGPACPAAGIVSFRFRARNACPKAIATASDMRSE